MEGREAIEREVETRLRETMPEVDLREVAITGRAGSGTLRAVIDHPDGVDHDLCARVTRVLGDAGMLDRYSVEVSSPGPEPPLRTLEHFQRAIGRRVQVKMAEPAPQGQRSCTGTLVAAGPEAVSIASRDGVVEVPRSAIRRARALAGGHEDA